MAAATREQRQAQAVDARLRHATYAEIGQLLGAVHTVQAADGQAAVKLPGGLWIITQRGVATENLSPARIRR